jgi:hypothetical protein
MPSQLIDKIADLAAITSELDGGSGRAAVKDFGPAFDQVGEIRGVDPRHHQLAAVHFVAGEVFDLDHLDEALELLAHLVDLGVAGVNSERHSEQARLAARSDRDGTHVETSAADQTRNLAQRSGAVLDHH